jgi:hypothetical protein
MPLAVYRLVVAAIVSWAGASGATLDDFDRPPIEYGKSTPENAVSQFQRRIDAGECRLVFEPGRGYLASLLAALDVPVESQALVFSKTSLQRQRISPKRPRAVYFNDEVYVGFCRSGEVLEISVADPKLGTVFYTLDQEETERPTFVRQTDNCLLCHGSSRTGGVPGHIVRSLFVDASGEPILSAGSTMVDHTTPFEKRWGGWYVTGTHGSQKHGGNVLIRGTAAPHEIDNSDGQNVTDLGSRVKLDGYLSPHSDIVALMVLEHQSLVHNRLTQANFAARQALDYEATLNKALGEPEGNRLDSTTRRIASAGDDLVEALLFVDEAALTATVTGTSGYAERFSSRGPRDGKGRSLREFDLKRRLFRYPCSYLVYSRSFDALPEVMREYVWKRLGSILSGEDTSKPFAHLSPDDRQAIREIIRDTKPGLPPYWR